VIKIEIMRSIQPIIYKNSIQKNDGKKTNDSCLPVLKVFSGTEKKRYGIMGGSLAFFVKI